MLRREEKGVGVHSSALRPSLPAVHGGLQIAGGGQ